MQLISARAGVQGCDVHNGVLFLEFARNVLEMMRQPLEDRSVTLASSAMTLSFPASFLLICALNVGAGAVPVQIHPW